LNTLILVVFSIGHALITFENKVKINKAAIALFSGGVIWSIYILSKSNSEEIVQQLIEHVGSISPMCELGLF
jgi:hypothetical protein